jgi:hypothetical protein
MITAYFFLLFFFAPKQVRDVTTSPPSSASLFGARQKRTKPACRQAGKEPDKACLSADRDYIPFVGSSYIQQLCYCGFNI